MESAPFWYWGCGWFHYTKNRCYFVVKKGSISYAMPVLSRDWLYFRGGKVELQLYIFQGLDSIFELGKLSKLRCPLKWTELFIKYITEKQKIHINKCHRHSKSCQQGDGWRIEAEYRGGEILLLFPLYICAYARTITSFLRITPVSCGQIPAPRESDQLNHKQGGQSVCQVAAVLGKYAGYAKSRKEWTWR